MTDRRKRNKDVGAKSPSGSFEVGYGRPPRHTQFQKGQPRPPRKARSEPAPPTFEEYLAGVLQEPMPIKENGVEQTVPKGLALAKASVNGAIKNGDPRRIKDYLPRAKAEAEFDFSQTDLGMIARFLVKQVPGGLEGLKQLLGDPKSLEEDSGRPEGNANEEEEEGQ